MTLTGWRRTILAGYMDSAGLRGESAARDQGYADVDKVLYRVLCILPYVTPSSQ